ncbi:beta-galactosidase [Pedobacter ginsengisoli]|uniref:Beta-galactosidase n=1 Tax=Pedobacter ginsengisoli TaxID=363852 RepID=A0A2D1U8G8_9SPHI|nr:glycoside hydrolase family 2 TIM barrel-domain containing protein [Pedobacter ginsengisoli]ATP57898.1 beta-galactosidase [Pedobacter ginsengisoli]
MRNRNTIVLLILFLLNAPPAEAALTHARETNRIIIPLNNGWQFYFAYNFETNIKKDLVNLPHTWNAAEVLNGVADYKRTSAVYENKLNVADNWKGKRLFLYFEGTNSVATLLINNKFVTDHQGGYTAFCAEITNFITPGENSITVQVSNAYRQDVIPLHGDFNVYGGIHRPVSLIITNQNCISPLDYGSPGIYIKQKNLSAQSANIEVLSKLSILNRKSLRLKTIIYDKDKKPVSSVITKINSENELKQDLHINKPHLWEGKASPYLYAVEVSLLQDEVTIDKIVQPLGLRSFLVEPNKGFFLNGKYLNLYGVGRHEDVSGRGSALTIEDQYRDMSLIQELGATSVRLTHYPQNKLFYNLSDSAGLILWTEIPFVGPGGYNGTGYIKNEKLEANIRKTLREMIRQNYNHPSIFFWGLFNELKLNYDNPQPFINELNVLAKKEDPDRLTTLASNLGSDTFTDLSDLMGWNQYFGWYDGVFEQVGTWADEIHRALPNKPISVSEYGAGASPFKHTEELQKPVPKGRFHPEEWQTAFHEKHWAEFKKRPYIWGKYVWVLADFGSSIRTEGDQDAINDKGLLTYDRKIKKDAFYFYKANWNPEPVLYISERRNTKRTKSLTSIKVFSNGKKTELLVNGKSYGKKEKNELNTIVWDNIPLQEGKNKIVVKSQIKGKWLQDRCEWYLTTAT